MHNFGYWMIGFKDGTTLEQFDQTSHLFKHIEGHFAGGEVPYKAINWSEVASITFVDVETSTGATYTVAQPPEGLKLSLRSRHFKAQTGIDAMCFMVVLSKAGEESDKDNTDSVLYWFPDHSVHACDRFDCGEIYKYGADIIHGNSKRLMPLHAHLETQIDAHLV